MFCHHHLFHYTQKRCPSPTGIFCGFIKGKQESCCTVTRSMTASYNSMPGDLGGPPGGGGATLGASRWIQVSKQTNGALRADSSRPKLQRPEGTWPAAGMTVRWALGCTEWPWSQTEQTMHYLSLVLWLLTSHSGTVSTHLTSRSCRLNEIMQLGAINT